MRSYDGICEEYGLNPNLESHSNIAIDIWIGTPMAQLDAPMDANNVPPSAPFVVLPADEYLVQIINSSNKVTKDGRGKYLELEMAVLDGEHKDRKVFDRLNLVNPSAQTVEIAQRTLSAICHATGVMTVANSEQLHFKPMVAKVTVKPARKDEKTGKTYEASNEVKGYRSPEGDYPTASSSPPAGKQQPQRPAAQTPAATAPASKPAGGAPPWRRK